MSLISALKSNKHEDDGLEDVLLTHDNNINGHNEEAASRSVLLEEYDYTGDESVPRVMLPASKIYQKPGSSLSKEALYKTKLKYGMYESPATHISLGIPNKNTSISQAAKFAERSSMVIKRYERDEIDKNAFIAAKNLSQYVLNCMNKEKERLSKQEKISLLEKEKKDRFYSTSSASAALKESSYIIKNARGNGSPRMDVRKKMNLSQVLTGAEKRASKRIDNRFVPELRSTISKRKEIANIAAHAVQAENYLPEKLEQQRRHELELQKQKMDLFKLMTSENVWKLAIAKTQDRLKSYEHLDTESLLFGNMEYNRKAVQLSTAELKKSRELESELNEKTEGKINVGGGMWISNRDIDAIARGLIKPILKEVENKASDERIKDAEIEQRNYTYENGLELWKQLQLLRNKNDNELVTMTRELHKSEKSNFQLTSSKKLSEIKSDLDKKLNQEKEELLNLQNQKRELEQNLDSKLAANKQKNEKRFANWMLLNEEDVLDLQGKENEILKPYYDGLEESRNEHRKIQTDVQELHIEVKDLKNQIQQHDSNIINMNDELELEAIPTTVSKKVEETEEKKSVLSMISSKKERERRKSIGHVHTLERNIDREKKIVETKRNKLYKLEKELSIRENELELCKQELSLREEKVDLLNSLRHPEEMKYVGEGELDKNEEFQGAMLEGKEDLNESDVIKKQNTIASEEDARVVENSDAERDNDQGLLPEDNIGEVGKAVRATHLGKPVIVNTAYIDTKNKDMTNYHRDEIAQPIRAHAVDEKNNILVGSSADTYGVAQTTGKNEKHSKTKPLTFKQYKRQGFHEPVTSVTLKVEYPVTGKVIKSNGKSNDIDRNSTDTIDVLQNEESVSFSGFSQGSIENEPSEEELSLSNNKKEDEVPGTSASKKRESLFKEVF